VIGRTVSHFKILEKLGSGGMGDVYRATDLELQRDVAIKVLREELASDPERLRRFEQEARSASALNHPNIITIHEIARVDSTPYIAMELVDGVTLRELLHDGPLPTDKLLQISTQLAEGLAKAHTAGIVHRDLKPENIMITRDGFVKILDFGLAKLTASILPRRSLGEGGSNVATMAKDDTSPGMIMGSVGYMSPEQAKGKTADFRADQFAFGAILYEMATGKRTFQGDTPMETLSAIIKEKPDLRTDLPANLQTMVERCLGKSPEERYGSTLDLARDLNSIGESSKQHRWPRPVAVVSLLAVILAVVLALYVVGFREKEPEAIDSIAVLPLDNLSGDPEQEYFSDGMTEALTAELAKISALRVISRQSVMRFKDSDQPLPEIADALNVDAVVEGSVLRSGDRVRITTQLIQAVPERHLWAESYERDLRDVLSLQRDVARTITQEIRIKLTAQEESLLTRAPPVNPEAQDAYLKGLYHWNKRSREGHEKALEYFQQAIETDPDYAPAYAGLAGCYGTFAGWAYAAPHDAYPKAKAAALKAIELDENLADSYVVLAEVYLSFDWNWPAAERAIKHAIELNPNHARARVIYSFYFMIHGQGDEALFEARRARELGPLNYVTNWGLGFALAESGQPDEAIDQYLKTLELESSFAPAFEGLFEAYYLKGMQQESLAARKKRDELWGFHEVVDAMDQGQEASGFKEAMARGARTLVELKRSNQDYVSSWDIALLYTIAEDRSQALDWLEQAYDERDPWLPYINGPIWDPIRSDPRFQDILRRMNLPE
jgi:serine/threonine protein kinase/tetratricopeptide (TPR) repeat protein